MRTVSAILTWCDMKEKTLLLKGIVGSHAYGYATPDSDIDYMSVWLDPVESYLGLNSKSSAKQSVTEEEDNTQFEFLHFMSLCEKFNPNVIPLLFLKEYEYVHPAMEVVLNNRELFFSKLAYNTLYGYATSQAKKTLGLVTGKKGEKRKAVIGKYGYDTKAAAHCIRLLEMGIGLFARGEVNLTYSAAVCKDIRDGKFTYEQYENYRLLSLDMMKMWFDKCPLLRDAPDRTQMNWMCAKVFGDVWGVNTVCLL